MLLKGHKVYFDLFTGEIYGTVSRDLSNWKKKTLHGDRVPEDKPDFIFSSEHHAS
jgi:hypothetical protein